MTGALRRHFGKLAVAVLAGMAAWVWTARGDLSFPQSPPPLQKPNLEVRIKDHREAIADFGNLEVTVDSIRIRPRSLLGFPAGRTVLKPSLEKIDITNYLGARAASVFKGRVNQGSFDGIDLRLKGIEGRLKKGGSAAVKNLVTPVRLLFSTDKENNTLIILDLTVLDVSDHPPQGYELHLRGYELYRNGKLVERVPPA